MMSFQISITPKRRAATEFINNVRRMLQRTLVDSGMTQAEIARALGVDRSVVNRELRGHNNLTLGRVAELAWAMKHKAQFDLHPIALPKGSNVASDYLTVPLNNNGLIVMKSEGEKQTGVVTQAVGTN